MIDQSNRAGKFHYIESMFVFILLLARNYYYYSSSYFCCLIECVCFCLFVFRKERLLAAQCPPSPPPANWLVGWSGFAQLSGSRLFLSLHSLLACLRKVLHTHFFLTYLAHPSPKLSIFDQTTPSRSYGGM